MGGTSWRFPTAVSDAVRDLSEPGSVAIAAGTTVADLFKLGHYQGATFVDLTRLPLNEILFVDAQLQIGALATNSEVAANDIVRTKFPVLAEAIESGASQQIRNTATVGGNILQSTRCSYFRSTDWPCNRRLPGSGCEAIFAPMENHAILGGNSTCIAVHPSDMAVALLALDACLLISGEDGDRTVSLQDFFQLPGEDASVTSNLRPNEIITKVMVPLPARDSRSAYLKLRGRASYEFAAASVAAVVTIAEGSPARIAIALGGVGTVPWRNRSAEIALSASEFRPSDIDMYCDHLLSEAVLRPETSHKAVLVRGAMHRVLARLVHQ